MAVTPDTNIKLLKCNLNLDESNQINFANTTTQYNYFNSLPKLEIDKVTYQRHNNVIRYPAHIDSIIEYNYVMYQNHNYTNKWFYAYITRMEYVNDNMTNIYIKTDPYQTWQFDLTFMRSFVEREHVNNDTVGLHTIDEGLGTGDYLQATAPVQINSMNISDMAVCMAVSQLPTGIDFNDNSQHTINGIYSGLYYLIFSDSESLANTAEKVDNFIKLYDESAKATAINGIFMIPKAFGIGLSGMTLITKTISGKTYTFYLPTNINTYKELTNDITVALNTTLAESYSPVNNKLKCFPYNYLLVSNNAGIDTIFHYEDFTNNTPKFKVIGAITPGCSIKCVPINYLKQSDSNSFKSFNYGVVGAKLPVCAWTNDVYTNWLTENGVSVAISAASSTVSTLIGVAALSNPATALAGASMVTAGIAGVSNALAEERKASLAPDQANGNVASGDITFSSGNSGFTAYRMSIRKEVAQELDNYFSMYGYKVTTLKVPNITGRRNWNYVKTINANIEGYIPQEDLDEIKNMFNNGVTIWHNSSTFLDYSQNNDII